ncbi:MAG: RNA-binding protein [Thermoproteales archaeon]|nr:RNA-binding protein [Thermoproteales archaeon]
MTLYVKNKQVVIPGETIAYGKYDLQGPVYVLKQRVYSKVIGVVEVDEKKKINLIPLKGKYVPREGDFIIGKIVDVGITGWTVDINAPYKAVLPASEVLAKPTDAAKLDLSEILDIGDLIVAKVIAFDYTRDPLLTIKESKLGKITKGTLVEITPVKIPRVIGRKGSMINMIKSILNVELVVGKNGRILVVGDDPLKEALAVIAIKKIEREAHVPGLTNRMKKFLEKLVKGEKAR